MFVPSKPKLTWLLFEKVKALTLPEVVPPLTLMAWEAVTTELLLIPKVTPFELLKTTVPLVAVWVPA